MNEAGYTLTETLAAMVVIGLAIGGYSFGMQVLGAQQSAVAATVLKAREVRAAEMWLERRLTEHAPYRAHEAGRFSGGATGFRFDCGAAAACAVDTVEATGGRRLRVSKGEGQAVTFRLPTAETTRFVYRGAGEVLPSWPPGASGRQALHSISLLQGEGVRERAVFEARIRAEQPLDCQFDPVMQDCR
jgi:prepilin-type N-terminal cleavage/methylation domain-containing protein